MQLVQRFVVWGPVSTGPSGNLRALPLQPKSLFMSGAGVGALPKSKGVTEDEMSGMKNVTMYIPLPSPDLSMPRSEWLSRVMRKHTDVLELRERLRPVSAVHSFARNKISAKTEVKDVLSDKVVDALIMQFLAEENCTSTLQILEKDLKASCMHL